MDKSILVINSCGKQCGIYQYGLNFYETLKKSNLFKVDYASAEPISTVGRVSSDLVRILNASAIIYNHYDVAMLKNNVDTIRSINPKIIHISIIHDKQLDFFDYYLFADPTMQETGKVIKIPRIIPSYVPIDASPDFTIGSFGFGAGGKFERLINKVNEEYNKAIISLLIPFNDIIDPDGRIYALKTASKCKELVKRLNKPGLALRICHDFLTKNQVLDFLSQNTINAFLYDEVTHCGISSTVDYALAARRPIAISRTKMFRHLHGATPSICVEENSLQNIVQNGTAPLAPFYQWTEENFITNMERILTNIFNGGI